MSQRLLGDKHTLNLEIAQWNQATFGANNLKVYDPKIWNSLPCKRKNSENLDVFKNIIKN